MMGSTHALFGLTTVAAAYQLAGQVELFGGDNIHLGGVDLPAGLLLAAGVGIVGSLLPDADAEDSAILRDLGWSGWLVKAGLKLLGVRHRGVLHSGLAGLGVLVAAIGLGWWLGWPGVGAALGLGYASHILADSLTISGVPLLWPAPKRFHLLPRWGRIRTGGAVEGLVFMAMTGLCALLIVEIMAG